MRIKINWQISLNWQKLVGTKQFCCELRTEDTKLKQSQKFNSLGNVNFWDIITMKGLANLTTTEHTEWKGEESCF